MRGAKAPAAVVKAVRASDRDRAESIVRMAARSRSANSICRLAGSGRRRSGRHRLRLPFGDGRPRLVALPRRGSEGVGQLGGATLRVFELRRGGTGALEIDRERRRAIAFGGDLGGVPRPLGVEVVLETGANGVELTREPGPFLIERAGGARLLRLECRTGARPFAFELFAYAGRRVFDGAAEIILERGLEFLLQCGVALCHGPCGGFVEFAAQSRHLFEEMIVGLRLLLFELPLEALFPFLAGGLELRAPFVVFRLARGARCLGRAFGDERFGMLPGVRHCCLALRPQPRSEPGQLGFEVGLQPGTDRVDCMTKLVIGHFRHYRDRSEPSQGLRMGATSSPTTV